MTDDRCVHDMLPGQCALCAPKPTVSAAPRDRQVWALPTSAKFHRADCYTFDAVHEANLVRGIPDNQRRWLTVGDAVEAGLLPCEACAPDVG